MKDTKRREAESIEEHEFENAEHAGDEGAEDEHSMEQEADLEARLATLAGRVVELESDLSDARTALETTERERAMDALIAGSGAVDPETVRLLLRREMEASPESEAGDLLAGLRDRKPVLFRRTPGAGSAMSAKAPGGAPAGLIAARKAAEEGDRASLLKYLRLRREQS